jgi:TPR repeat protein
MSKKKINKRSSVNNIVIKEEKDITIPDYYTIQDYFRHQRNPEKQLSDYVNNIRKLSAEGDLKALTDLSFFQYCGIGVKLDPNVALKNLRFAEKQHYLPANFHLGQLRLICPKLRYVDFPKARENFKKGAELGDPLCQNSYAFMCLNGIGGPISTTEAHNYFHLAYLQDNTPVLTNLGLLHLDGTVPEFPKDIKLAEKYLIKGADKVDSNAMVILAKMNTYGINSKHINYREGEYWASKAASLGNPIGQELVGRFYMVGNCDRIKLNYETAFEMFLKCISHKKPMIPPYLFSIQHNPNSAFNNLGFLLAKGLGVPADISQAIFFFKKATEGPFPCISSLINLGVLYQFGIGVTIDHAKTLNYYDEVVKANIKLSPIINRLLKIGFSPLSTEQVLLLLYASDLPKNPKNSYTYDSVLQNIYNFK